MAVISSEYVGIQDISSFCYSGQFLPLDLQGVALNQN